jgi:transposase, IS5 family
LRYEGANVGLEIELFQQISCLTLQHAPLYFIMRHAFQAQPDRQRTPIEKIRLPLKSRDELPPILAGLQWVWMHPPLKAEIFALLEAKILAGKQATGRTGMDLWQMLVLGGVRLGLAADWDRLEHVANYDSLVRQMLGVPAAPWGEADKRFGHQTLRDNVALLDDELLQPINARIAAAGREVFAKKAGAPLAALELKVDRYVLATDVPFPTDLNRLWDAGRKCVDLVEKFRRSGYALPGWRDGQGLAAAAQEPPTHRQPGGLSRRAEQGSPRAKNRA